MGDNPKRDREWNQREIKRRKSEGELLNSSKSDGKAKR
jgi:hypothetical protein